MASFEIGALQTLRNSTRQSVQQWILSSKHLFPNCEVSQLARQLLSLHNEYLPKNYSSMSQFVFRTLKRNFVGRKVPTRISNVLNVRMKLKIKKKMNLQNKDKLS